MLLLGYKHSGEQSKPRRTILNLVSVNSCHCSCSLTTAVEVSQPPASAVRKFLSLLEQSDLDFTEELECQRLKAQVVQQIRANQQLEQDLSVMDIKIGLLVRNRISLQVRALHGGCGAIGHCCCPRMWCRIRIK